MGKPIVDANSTLWRRAKPGWGTSRLAPKRTGVWSKISAGLAASTAHRNKSITKTPLSFVAHRGLTFLASTIPMASLVFDSLTIANIIKQFDPKFEIAPNQLSDEGYKNMLLAHVRNKVLSENQGESQQGMMMLRTMRRYAEKVSQQKTHPRNESARQFLSHLNMAQKQVDKVYVQHRKENQQGVQFHQLVSGRGFARAPIHLQKYAVPATNREQMLARLKASQNRITPKDLTAIPRMRQTMQPEARSNQPQTRPDNVINVDFNRKKESRPPKQGRTTPLKKTA